MATVKRIAYTVTYNGKEITTDISPMVLSITYTDKTENESDTIELTMDDTDGLWRDTWYPTKGDTLDVSIGYEDLLLPCGTFEVDEIEVSGPPDQVTIRGLATGISKAMRTKNNSAHEGKTLGKIAKTIAGKHGLTVEGTIESITLNRVTQHRETDLEFLRRISWEYGHLFSIRGAKMIFTTIYDIEAADAADTIERSDLMRWSFRDKTSKTYKSAQVKYHDPNEKKVVQATEETDADDTADDTLVIQTKAESTAQAKSKAKAALHRANSRRLEGGFTLPGNPLLVAGNNVQLVGFGKVDGKYHVEESRHSLSRSSGYVTDVTVKKVG